MNRPGPRPSPLPEHLGSGFQASSALAAGVTPRRLRAAGFDRTYWGLRAAAPLDTVIARCRLVQLRMPPLAFYSHSTAALLFGIPIPYGSERDDSLHVTLPAPARAPHATGIQGHRLSIREGDVTEVDGVRRTTPARTWCDLASILSLVDLVAAGDFLIHHRSPLVSIGQLAAAVGLHKNRRGLRKLREALLLLSDRSESPPESVLRVLLIQAGFPEPHINHSVNDRFGEFVARSDFIIEEYRLILEYQGDYHRTTKGQWRADMTRRSKLEAEGWKVMELNADDLRDPIELMTRIWARARQS